MKRLLLIPAIVAFSAGTALAQGATEDQVTISLENLEPEIAATMVADPTAEFPETVKAPAWVAESACNIDSATLAAQITEGNAFCVAGTSSPELMRIVEEVMVAGYTTNDQDRMSTGSVDDSNTGGVDGSPDDNGALD